MNHSDRPSGPDLLDLVLAAQAFCSELDAAARAWLAVPENRAALERFLRACSEWEQPVLYVPRE